MDSTAIDAPIVDWIDPDALLADPYPTYARLRREAPVAYAPALRRYLVTTFRDCFDVEMDQQTFSSHEDARRSTMIRSMGRPMLRKDDPDHKRDRNAFGAALRPRTVKNRWADVFSRIAARYIERLRKEGPGVDLFHHFAVPYAADNLSALIGFRGVDAYTMMDWSHTLIAGIGNIRDDAAVWAQTARVSAEIDGAIDEAIAALRDQPDDSIISSILRAPQPISEEDLRANVRLTISGGMNEPSHVISSALWCLASYPEQRDRVLAGERTWAQVFDETARLQSPVGMYPRTVTQDTVLHGVAIPAGATVAVIVASANRDEAHFPSPDAFDLDREKVTNLAFGNGTHICAGNWVARAMVGDIALPLLHDALPELRVIAPEDVNFRGWVFRGTTHLPVTWDPA